MACIVVIVLVADDRSGCDEPSENTGLRNFMQESEGPGAVLGFGRPVGYVLQGIEGVVRKVAESMAAAPGSEAVDPDTSHSVTLKICNCDQIEIRLLRI